MKLKKEDIKKIAFSIGRKNSFDISRDAFQQNRYRSLKLQG